jgi:hypothetical protein
VAVASGNGGPVADGFRSGGGGSVGGVRGQRGVEAASGDPRRWAGMRTSGRGPGRRRAGRRGHRGRAGGMGPGR